MTSDELLDAHCQRLRDDPGYVTIWRQAHEQPHMQEIVMMLAWAEQADGLRAMARTGAEESIRVMAIECPYCGIGFGVRIATPSTTPQTNT